MIQARGSLRKGSQRFFLMVESANLTLTGQAEVSEAAASSQSPTKEGLTSP